MTTGQPRNPNAAVYQLRWNDRGTPYVHPNTHHMFFALDEAMRIAGYQPVSVIDSGTGRVLWIGSEATRGAFGPRPRSRRCPECHADEGSGTQVINGIAAAHCPGCGTPESPFIADRPEPEPHDEGTSYCTNLPEHEHDTEPCPECSSLLAYSHDDGCSHA